MEHVYHFIGIGGIGMSGLARILLQQGKKVQGSDIASSAITEQLKQLGATIFLGHSDTNIQGMCTVIYNTDIPQDNPEYQKAKRLGYPILHRSDLLKILLEPYFALLVTGTHGKTTTSSLLAHVMIESKQNPGFAIGGILKNLGTNAGYGRGNYFVAEADESDGSFLKYPYLGAIITNIDLDHLNHWKSEKALIEGFDAFARHSSHPEHLFWCCDDERLRSLCIHGISYGFSLDADLRVYDFVQEGWQLSFSFSFQGKEYVEVKVPLIGHHNALNAAAVFGLVLSLGIDEDLIRSAFLSFTGVGRRADKKGEASSIEFYDDYGHHPTEVIATLKALKQASPTRRLIAIFQPHRYTRTRDCIEEFASAFGHADCLVLTDIYPAGEKPIEGVSSEVLFEKIKQKKDEEIYYITNTHLSTFLIEFLQPHDVVVTMGAGDITKFGPHMIEKLRSCRC